MNILCSQEIKQVEIFLAKIPANPKFKLKLPSQKQLQNMPTFSASIFPTATQSTQKELQRLLSLSDNMRGLSQTHTNSVFHMLTFTLINLLYQDKFINAKEANDNHYLLQTIKSSLYSNDMEFKAIKNVDFAFDSVQLKILVKDFLLFMEQQSRTIKTNRIKCAQWIFQQNPILLTTFTLFFRVILSKIGMEEAKDYQKSINSQEAIANIIQFFDLHYRNLGELILFYEDGLFLSIVDSEIVLGEFYENSMEKENQKQQLEIKSDVKMNMIESVLVNVEKTSNITPKKKAIVESDLQLFNFMLQSRGSDASQKVFLQKQKQLELQTPHFKQSCTDNFQFLRKKRPFQFKREEVRNQFQKLMMDDDASEQEVKQMTEKIISNKTSEPKKLEVPKSSPFKIEGLKTTTLKQPPKNYVSHANFRKTTEQKENYTKIFKETAPKQMDRSFCSGETHCVSSQSNNKENSADLWTQITNCSCRKARLSRNFLSSKVLDINVILESSQRRFGYLNGFNSPRTLNNYRSTNEKKELQCQIFGKNGSNQLAKYQQKICAYKKPAFLNNLKKLKVLKVSEDDYSKSLVNQGKKNQESAKKQKSHKYLTKQGVGNFKSCTQLREIGKNQSKSTPKYYQNRATKIVFDSGQQQRVNQKMGNLGFCSGIAKPWQTNSNFVQKIPQYNQITRIKSSDISKANPEAKTSNINNVINSPRGFKQEISPLKLKIDLVKSREMGQKTKMF